MIYEEKKRLRAAFREAAAQVTDQQIEEFSREVLDRVERLAQFSGSHTVAVYYPLRGEISTMRLLHMWDSRKRLLLPAIESGVMVFREYTGESDLFFGPFGIRQPRRGRIVAPADIGIMLVPGMAFDREGHRLGRGKGFYDRYFATPGAEGIHKVGLCLPHQLVDEIPFEDHDVMMDQIVTVETAMA